MHLGRLFVVIMVVVFLTVSSAAAQKAPAGSTGKAKSGVVAVVNGSGISLDDFNRELYGAERSIIAAGRFLSAPQVTRLRTEVVENLVKRELLYQEGKKTVRVTDAEITAELEKLKGQFRSETEFASVSASLRPQIEKQLTITKYIETAYASKAQVTDGELRSYYDKNRDAFRQPEQVKASYILLIVDPRWDKAKKDEAKKKMEGIQAKARSGEDFASLARSYSEDPSSSRGGDLGYVRHGQIIEPLEKALFALRTGEVSHVIEAGVGYHILKATDRKPEAMIPLDQVKDRLRVLLKQEKGLKAADAYIAGMRKKAKVQISLPPEE